MSERYAIRPGVTLQTVAGEYLLIAANEAQPFCPYVQQLNSTAAYLWSLLADGMDVDRMTEEAARHFDIPKQDIESDIRVLLNRFRDKCCITLYQKS